MAKPAKAKSFSETKAEATLKTESQFLKFEQNIGQFAQANFLYRATDAQATYFFTKNEIRSVVNSSKDSMQTAYALQFVGANEGVDIKGIGKSRPENGATNYITDAGSFGDVPMHNRLHYNNLWDGVNAYFYESREGKGTMKYDFIVQPNADPSVVRLKMDGVTDLKINANGELEFTTPFGTLQKGKPYTYQIVDGKQVEVTSNYTLNEQGEIGFKIGNYNAALPLVIDPIALKWSTYLMNGTNSVYDIYVHPTMGRIYIVGRTQSGAFPNTLGRPYGGGRDAFVTCMEKDGTTLVWSTFLGGSGDETAYAVSVDAADDVYVVGKTTSTDFPVNGTTTAYDATHNGGTDIFIARLNSTGATLKYSTFLGGSSNDGNSSSIFSKLVEDNGKVYVGANSNSINFPTSPGAYQTSKSGANVASVLFCLNTNVGGAAGLEMSTYFNGLQGTSSSNSSIFNEIEQDKDGNLWLIGNAGFTTDFPISANAVQQYADFGYTGTTDADFVVKFSKTGQYLYSSWVHPLWSPSNVIGAWGTQNVPSLDVDAAGNVYVGAATYLNGTTAATVKKASNILAFHELSPLSKLQSGSNMALGYLAKIPYDLSPQYDFVSVFPSNTANNFADPEVAVDKKGNIHLLTQGGDYDNDFYHPLTAGAVNTVAGSDGPSIYYVLPPSGNSVLYGTVLNSNFAFAYFGMFVNDKCEAYLISESYGGTSNYPITPSYRDFETNSQKTVYNSTVNSGWALSVFHEPIPNNNTIPNFAVGNNTFCVGGAIWQNPNDGPILGATATYTSGDGSASTHNLPNIRYAGATPVAHPTPASPAIAYQWQKRVNGGAWTNVGNGTYEVYKPEPESTAGTVEYRRIIQGTLCCDSVSVSNVASATITGTFNMVVSTPTKPVYYCPTVAGTSLGVTITGASGNISWQWYDGFSPLSGTGIISPSSGSGVAQGSFTAEVGTLVTGSGFYRLVVTDAGGCKREAYVAIAPKTADAGSASSIALCPGGTASATIGPPAVNPDFVYSWTGPSGFTSTLANPVVTTAGTYTLQVKLTGDASFCAPGTTVTVTAVTAHSVSLVDIPNKGFCQPDSPAGIGLSGTPPSGYVFQWVPGTNLDDQQAYNPKFDPGSVPGGPAIGTINYTFSALRLSDGCIFEDQVTVTDTARALAQAGIDYPACGTNPSVTHGAPETQGNYFQWRVVATTYPGGVAALTSHAKFKMDGVATNLGTNKFVTSFFPDHTACYTIDYEIIGSYVPFPTNCTTRDTARLFYCPTCGGDWCSDLTSNAAGTTGACGGSANWIGGESLGGLTYTWETHSVNGVVQSGSNRQPRGLYTLNADSTKGAAISAAGPHASKAIADFDNAVWGWSGANVVIYRLKATGNFGEGVIDCHRDIQVFNPNNSTPVIGVLDQSLCSIVSPGIRLGTTGQAAPYLLTGLDYSQAPSSAFNWSWTNLDGTVATTITSGATTAFPTVNPTSTTQYMVIARDPATGCFAKDTLTVNVKSVIANAGSNLTNICPGSLVQLGTTAQDGHTYSWSPSAGLNFPIGTPNSTTAQPYLSVPSVPAAPTTLTYTVTVTDSETGCQATEDMTIGTTTTAPPALTAATYSGCASTSFTFGPSSSLTGATYQWAVQSGTANLTWLSSTTVRQPIVTLPVGFTGPAVFRLTMTKGTCGSVFADYTINSNNPAMALGGPYTAVCAAPSTTAIGETALVGFTYSWSPISGLFISNTLATAYSGSNLATVFARPTETTTYTVTRTNSTTGCVQTATVTVNPPTGVAVNAGVDKSYCIGGSSITIGSTGSGTLSWTAIGYIADPLAATPSTIAAPMTGATMLGYIGGSANSPTRSFATGTPSVGKYVYRVTSTNGACSITDDVVVTVPSVPSGFAGASKNVCLGESVQLGSATAPSTGTYAWSAINPNTENGTIDDQSKKRPIVTPSVNTTYQVIFTDGGSGCVVDEQVSVVVNPKPNVADVSTTIACAPLSAQNLTTLVSGYGSLVSPVWYKTQYPGGTVISTPTSVTPTATTDYYLLSQNTYGCYDTAKVTINVASPQTPNIATSVNVDCSTLTIDLANYQGTPSQVGYTLEWHSANNTLAGTLLSSTVVSTGTYYLFEKAPSPSNCYSASDNIIVSTAHCPCELLVTPSVSGCYQNGGASKSTVSVEVKWENATVSPTANDASDAITVTFGGQTHTINPGTYTSTGGNGTIVSPQVVAFEVNADASTQTVQAFFGASYAASTCKNEQTGVVLPAACPPSVCTGAELGGKAYADYNADGIKQSGETNGVAGVTVTVYDCAGNSQTATTDANGDWKITTALTYPVRVEFSTIPTLYGQGTPNGTDGRTTTQFIASADCNVDLGIVDPSDYCQLNPKIILPCYVAGDPLPSGSTAGGIDAVVAFDYSTSGIQNTAVMSHAPASEVGTLWGMAYNKYTKRIFSAATVKRHAGLGTLGIGGIYVTNFSNPTTNGTFGYTPFVDVATLGINVGTIANNTARGLTTNPAATSMDNQGYLAVGKAGIGGIDLSADGNKLYFTNLFDNKLYEIDITAYNTNGTLPTIANSNIKSYDMSTGITCTGGNLRTWGVKVNKGKIYTGFICNAETSQDKSDLRAFVQELNGTTVTTVLDFPLTYPKGYTNSTWLSLTGWYPWTDDWATKITPNTTRISHPEPILTAIEFDIDGSMILAFGDRTGFQAGYFNVRPDIVSATLYRGFAGGDILRAAKLGSTFILENNAKAGVTTGALPNNGQGPGFGEFYDDNLYNLTALAHGETPIGGLVFRPGSGEVVAVTFDPINKTDAAQVDSNYFNVGGVRHLNNSTGAINSGYVVYQSGSSSSTGTSGKTVGLGDAIVNCNAPTFLEVGNYVWIDTDKDGVQDPCEPPLSNVTVSLWKGGTQIASTTTNSNGEYYFSSKYLLGAAWTGTGADTTLLPNMAYEVRISTTQTAITTGNYTLTTANATTNTGNDQNDSDASLTGSNAAIAFTTGAAGSTNHTYDFGFFSCPTITLPTDTAICSASTVNIRAVLTNINTESIKFVYFTSHETDPSVIYGNSSTDLGTVANASLTDSKTVATLAGVSFPVNITLSPIIYHVYAILEPDPGAGGCRVFAHRHYTVNPVVTPTFTAVSPICAGATLSALPTTSNNGITGTWAPALDNTTTTTYTFTPTAGQCATTTTLTITVNPVPSTPSVTSPQMNPCPATTVNLTTISAALTPSVVGGVFEWRVSNLSSSALVTGQTAVGNGTYYLFEKSTSDCYSAATTVQVQIQTCCPTPTCIPVIVVRNSGN